jgi:hypothetical protein
MKLGNYCSSVCELLVTLLTCFLSIGCYADANFTEVIAITGNSASLLCTLSRESPVDWLKRQLPLQEAPPYVTFNGAVTNNFRSRLTVRDGGFRLNISSVVLEDDGYYECVQGSGLGSKHTTHLVVRTSVLAEDSSPLPSSSNVDAVMTSSAAEDGFGPTHKETVLTIVVVVLCAVIPVIIVVAVIIIIIIISKLKL